MSVATLPATGGTAVAAGGHQPAGDLVRAAVRCEDGAWNDLVERFESLVRGIARSHGLHAADAADVSQAVWMRLVVHLDRLREPDRVAGWLATTARNECLRTLRQRGRATPTADLTVLESGDSGIGPDSALVARQRDAVLVELIETLPPTHRALLRVIMVEPQPSYREAASALGMPVGSIGPTRQRCLALLRTKCTAAGIAP